MFCYLDFDSYLKANYPNSLPFVLKSTFTFEIHCKKRLSTPKKAAKKIKGMQHTLRCSPENTKCSVTYNTIQCNTIQILLSTPHGGFSETNINSTGNQKKKLLLKLLRNYLHINL